MYAIRSYYAVLPGREEPIENEEDAIAVAEEIGYPVIIKASAGGGGIGMNVVYNKEELVDTIRITSYNVCYTKLLRSVPTSENYPIMNLSHAVSIILYELYYESTSGEIPYNLRMKKASKIEKDVLLKFFNEFVDISKGVPDYRKEICKTIFKRIVSRAFISGKEANSLVCVFKKMP